MNVTPTNTTAATPSPAAVGRRDINQLAERITGCAFRVHNTLGPGFLELVYENALRIELETAGMTVLQQHPIPVRYRTQIVGDYAADLFVQGAIIVEVKTVRALAKEHEVQLVHYLAATGVDDGLLINFGPRIEVRRKFRVYHEPDVRSQNSRSKERVDQAVIDRDRD